LEEAGREMQALDAGGLGNDTARYRRVVHLLEALPGELDPARLFQVDMIKPVKQATLGPAVVAEILRGSLLKRTIRHKRGCPKCERGGGHLAWVLTIGYAGGVTKQYSIRPEMKLQVERWLKNYQELKAKLEAICEINHALLRPEE